ncbi:MAG: hypothetical protein OK422_02925 [Thaumarchaeota archaeon]|nr:hypothetical protein [Nitrososphaerota archaeon]
MGKKDEYQHELRPLIDSSLETGGYGVLETYLVPQSKLSGPRANLELLEVFSEEVDKLGPSKRSEAWQLCVSLSRTESHFSDPREFVAVCGTASLGKIGGSDTYFKKSLRLLRELSHDKR